MTSNGLLAWTVPPAADIFSTPRRTYTYDDFNDYTLPAAVTRTSGVSVLSFELTLKTSTQSSIGCATKGGYCRIRYDEQSTPILHDVVPNNVVFGMTVNMVMNPNNCGSIPSYSDPFYYLKIGDTLTDWELNVNQTFRMPAWERTAIATVIGPNMPAKSQDPDASFTKFGRARLADTATHCSFDGAECWRVRVHPRIDKISAHAGYTEGGQNLIIEGWGLKAS